MCFLQWPLLALTVPQGGVNLSPLVSETGWVAACSVSKRLSSLSPSLFDRADRCPFVDGDGVAVDSPPPCT